LAATQIVSRLGDVTALTQDARVFERGFAAVNDRQDVIDLKSLAGTAALALVASASECLASDWDAELPWARHRWV
jgi:hypothetical protein